jgi:phosphate:Na+ symporter
MKEVDLFTIFYTAIGGLGLFFLGLRFLSESLQSIAGSFIQRLINVATSNRFTAVIVGVIVTVIVQSSSISTVMVVGLVNAGLMKLTQAIGVILGANVGTTITGWILVVKIGKYGLLLLGIGIFPMLFSKEQRFAAAGKCLVALGLIFQGLSFMSGAFKPLRDYEPFISNLTYFDAQSYLSILGCIVIGCILTFVIQSSSAMLGITIALATTGSITYPTAAALVLGENIGTTITAMLACVGTTTSAKRAAFSHAIFNICGVAIVFVFFQSYVQFVDSIVPGIPDEVSADGSKAYIAAHVAMGHTLFNVTATIIAIPLLGYLASLVTWLFPSSEEKEIHHLEYLGTAGTSNTEVALNMVELELRNMLKTVEKLFKYSDSYLRSESHDKKALDKIAKLEGITDNIDREITSFCCKVVEGELSPEQSVRAYALIRASNELESVSDYCDSISRYRYRLYRNDLSFSESGWSDINSYFSEVHDFFTCVVESLDNLDPSKIEKLSQIAAELNDKADVIRDNHLARMRSGDCKALPALTFSDIAVAMRRVKNHTVNLYEAMSYSLD